MPETNRDVRAVKRMFSALETNDLRDLDAFIAADDLNHESVNDGRSDLRRPAEFKETTAGCKTRSATVVLKRST
jgi:hypothetical protein